jgi:predicted KAP-like P-loop ATPase
LNALASDRRERRMPIHDGLDNPRSDPKDDIFNRYPFSKRLAETIVGFDTRNGAAVFGIFARWGYGKSTVLNYLKHELTTNHSDEVVVFEFNPWFFTGQEDLLAAFFSGLAARLEQALAGRTKDAGQILKKYSGIFGLIPIVGTGASKLAEQIGTEMSENSLANQRKRAFEIMSGAERTVVVLIDDLDRLDRDEILIMLKLIRLNANVPRVVYVLAFDDQMVAAAVGAKYNAGPELGRQFLEKIVQYPFTLPAVGRERLASFAMSQAQSACASAGVALTDQGWSAMGDIVDKCFLRRLTTPRPAIRYVNALEFALD